MPTQYTIDFEMTKRFVRPVTPQDLHKLACYLMEGLESAEHWSQSKTFTISSIVLVDGIELISPVSPRYLSVSLNRLIDEVDDHDLLVQQLRSRPNLGKEHPLTFVDVHIRQESFAQLSSLTPTSRVQVEFQTPAFFSRNGRKYFLPDPILIHQRLIQRWNDMQLGAGIHIDDDLARELTSHISLDACSIETVGGPSKSEGFMGTAVFGLMQAAPQTCHHLLSTLWGFAEYAGIGAQTTHGFGVVSVSRPPESP